MRIRVSGLSAAVEGDKRAYAEYRFFAAIAPYEAQVRTVDVVVSAAAGTTRRFLCTVSVDLGPSGRVETQARALHPTAAIDRAADRTGWLIGRRTGSNDFTLKSASFSS